MTQEPSDPIRGLPWLIWVVVIFGSISSAGFGFDQGWWSALMSSTQFVSNYGQLDPVTDTWALTSNQQSLGTGLGYVGVIVGVFGGSPVNERLGRKNTLWIQSFIVTIGIIIESTAEKSYAQFLVGKLLVYLGGGMATSVIPAYQGECAPKSMRGLMAGTYNAFLMVGGFFATLIVYLCQHIPSNWSWRVVVVAQIAIPAASWASLPFLPESPYWLVSRGRLDEAVVSLRRLRGVSFPAEAEVANMQQLLEEQQERRATATWSACVTDSVARRRTIIAVGSQIFSQAQGISFVANYQAVFLQEIGFKEVLLMSVVVFVIGIAANLIFMATADRLGRRNVLIYSAALMGAFMITIGGLTANGAEHMSYQMQVAAVVMLMLWFFTFQYTWGPIAWVLSSEIPPIQMREKSVALSGMGAYITGLIIVFVNPFTQADIGGRVAFIYGALSVLSVLFAWFYVPEVKNRSLEQIDEMFLDKVSARAFQSHVCRTPGDITIAKREAEEFVENA
ncbi:unnamed protein product [Penicillium olsonii]|uniref:Major facilitator superfamily (MFS) profile domain-containing protein n=1 Tax=Penicillium olsonii TaxID=99116 RepID=A0A9W4I0T1_PENOL|nr:unnamed protein product [Penicillium olsonii]CAG8232367.1 unnamed protein product [Penicillium olsonii]